MNRRQIIYTAIFVVIVAVPLWWWALRGMSENVGTAWVVTDYLSGVGLLALILVEGFKR